MTLRGARMLQWGAGLGELYQRTQLTAELCLGQFPIWWGSQSLCPGHYSDSSPCSLSVHVLCCGGRAHTKHCVFSHAADAGSRSSV